MIDVDLDAVVVWVVVPVLAAVFLLLVVPVQYPEAVFVSDWGEVDPDVRVVGDVGDFCSGDVLGCATFVDYEVVVFLDSRQAPLDMWVTCVHERLHVVDKGLGHEGFWGDVYFDGVAVLSGWSDSVCWGVALSPWR